MKRRLSLLLAVIMILGSFSFAFAAEETAAETAGAFLKKVGILEGINGDLKLEDNLRRQDAVVLVARLHGAEDKAKAYSPEGLTFTDFKDPYYRPIIKWAVDEKLVEGHTAERFGFNEDITVQQYATILLRALGYNGEAEDYDKVMELAKKLGLLENVKAEGKDAVTRGDMAVMTFNALGTELKGEKKTLAEKLGIEMPAPDKLEAKVLDTENLAEIVVELSNAKLVKNKDALLNPANYRLNNDVKVQHVHLDGNNVVLTLVPYGKVEEQGKFDSLIKGKKFNLTIRNIDPAINDTYRNIVAGDNAIPVVEEVDFIGTHGIKIVTSEPIANPLERNFRLDSRTSMIVEQYGRNIILTPYHGKEFDKEAVELTIDKLEDFAGYTSVKTVEKMTISTDEALPKVEAAYRSGKELIVEFDRDVYHNSVKAYENRRELGNVSFVERRVPFYAEKAEKVDTNVVKYTFTRDIPRGLEVTIEGVANHFNKAMEKENIVPVEYRDDYAPVVIDFDDTVAVTDKFEKELADLYKDKGEKEYNKELDKGKKVDTLEMAIEFDKDIAEFKDAKPEDIKVKDHFTLYELDITKRGENIANDVKISVKSVDKDSIELKFEGIKINNKDRDFDYILEVRNFTDTSRNRMEREYLDFQVVRQGKAFDVVELDIKNTRYFNRDGSEIVLKFNKVVNKEAAQDAKNYYLEGKLKVDEAIVQRDGKEVRLVVYDKDVDKLLKEYKVLEISPRVQQLDWPYSAPAHRFWDLKTRTSIGDPEGSEFALTFENAGVKHDPKDKLELDVNTTNNTISVTLKGKTGNQIEARLLDSKDKTVDVAFGEIKTDKEDVTVTVTVPVAKSAEYTLKVKGSETGELKIKVNEVAIKGKVVYLEDEEKDKDKKKAVVLEKGATSEIDPATGFVLPAETDLSKLNKGSFEVTADKDKNVSVDSVVYAYKAANPKAAELLVTLKAENGDTKQFVVPVVVKGAEVDKKALEAAKAEAEKVEEDKYTEESYKALTDALALPETTQEEVNVKVAAINDAINKLVPKETLPFKLVVRKQDVAGTPMAFYSLKDVKVDGAVKFTITYTDEDGESVTSDMTAIDEEVMEEIADVVTVTLYNNDGTQIGAPFTNVPVK